MNARFFLLGRERDQYRFASSYRLTSSRNSFRRSSTSSILEPNLYVIICKTVPCCLPNRTFRTSGTVVYHLCSELIELTSQHLNFLSRCHRHSISQYHNTRNESIPQFQDNLLRYHVRMGNRAKRVNVRCALWVMRAVFSLSDLGP